jgi:hypothetical protein
MIRLVCCLVLVSGCYLPTAYEPAICTDERMDTVGIWVEGQPYYVQPRCEIWRALSDSTKCWTNERERIVCP